jgi:hypothetical protein
MKGTCCFGYDGLPVRLPRSTQARLLRCTAARMAHGKLLQTFKTAVKTAYPLHSAAGGML